MQVSFRPNIYNKFMISLLYQKINLVLIIKQNLGKSTFHLTNFDHKSN